jgi:3-methyl-2-oxobutanoate hydroxymethyltransferase
MKKKSLNTRNIRKHKLSRGKKPLSMLTCYDFQTAQMLDETELDLILVGDSLGNVILGYENTVSVSIEEMSIFGSAVVRGAKNKFVIVDMPFGSYASLDMGLKNAIKLFQETKACALKLEGATDSSLKLIERLTETGIPVMGHIGLIPQSVHQMGGYFTHGKNEAAKEKLLNDAKNLQEAGCFSVVLECVEKNLSETITDSLAIPTIGIGSGNKTDGQVLVINDLLHLGKDAPPSFCAPMANMFNIKKGLVDYYLQSLSDKPVSSSTKTLTSQEEKTHEISQDQVQ